MIGGATVRELGMGLICGIALWFGAAFAAPGPGDAPALVRETEAGFVLTTPAGMTLYTSRFAVATPGKSKCNETHYTMQSGRHFWPPGMPGEWATGR